MAEHECIHCNSRDHDALSKQCPSYKKEELIKRKMAENNLSYMEAKIFVDSPNSSAKIATSNRFSPLENLGDFPALPSQSKNRQDSYFSTNRLKFSAAGAHQDTKRKRPRVMSPRPTSPLREFNMNSLPMKPVISQPNPYRPNNESQIVEILETVIHFIGAMIKSDKVITFDETSIRNQLLSILGEGAGGTDPTAK